jgi:hypothetical protein
MRRTLGSNLGNVFVFCCIQFLNILYFVCGSNYYIWWYFQLIIFCSTVFPILLHYFRSMFIYALIRIFFYPTRKSQPPTDHESNARGHAHQIHY